MRTLYRCGTTDKKLSLCASSTPTLFICTAGRSQPNKYALPGYTPECSSYLLPLSTMRATYLTCLTHIIFHGSTRCEYINYGTLSDSLVTMASNRHMMVCMWHWVAENWWGKHLAPVQLRPPQITCKLNSTRTAATRSRRVNHLFTGTAFRALLRHHSYYQHHRRYHFVLTFSVFVPR